MDKKFVLIVDEESSRAENLIFMVRLGGYDARIFNSTAAALNWVKYGCSVKEILCLLFNHPGELATADKIVADWIAADMMVPVVLVQRGGGSWNRFLSIAEKEHFFACDPEAVMQTLDILSVINFTDDGAGVAGEKLLVSGGMLGPLLPHGEGQRFPSP